jgi:S-methylmethionine-dependent homocysteine/selenocysteine methylase
MTQSLARLFDQHLFLTAGGTETYLQFLQHYPLRNFCAFELLDDDAAFTTLERAYLHPILDVAIDGRRGLLADALLWRATSDYVTALGYPAADVARFNRLGVERMRQSLERRRQQRGAEACPILVAADIGPRGDGYQVPAEAIAVEAAKDYYAPQLEAVAQAGVDVVCALTMTNVNEAVGIVEAARGRIHLEYRRGERRSAGVLHGQLRASQPPGARLGGREPAGRRLAPALQRLSRQRLEQDPRRARQLHEPRPGQPG